MKQEARDQILLDLKKGQEGLFKGQKELFEGQEARDQILLDLKKGQEELFKGQKELFEGQEARDQILLDLKRGQEELFKGQKELFEGQKELLGRVENLEYGLKDTNQELRSLSQTVAKIEHEHGHKLQILLDVVTSYPEKFDSTEKNLDLHEKRLNKHDDEIYYLNSKVQAF